MTSPSTLTSLLDFWEERNPDKVLYRFHQLESEPLTITVRELRREAQELAHALLQQVKRGDRVLLSLSDSREFIVSFFACLYAEITAIPAPALKGNQKQQRLNWMLSQSQPDLIVCDAGQFERFRELCKQLNLSSTKVSGSESIRAFANPSYQSLGDFSPEVLAFVQFTSGTTQAPRGACITHGNVMANLAQLQFAHKYRSDDEGLMWLPPYHDLGLIGGILHSLFVGSTLTLISPFDFARNPLLWLKCISDYRITVSGAPAFAYQKCVQAAKKVKQFELDLSSWRRANVSAELTAPSTLLEFSRVFSEFGFSDCAFVHSYGLAEATLGVSAATGGTLNSKIHRFQKRALYSLDAKIAAGNDEYIEFVSSGMVSDGLELKIVDPHTRMACPENRIGEIWLSGLNVTRRFMNNSSATKLALEAEQILEPGKHYCRTGDMGFIHKGELFLVGRTDQLLLHREKFVFSPWLESVVSTLTPELSRDGCAIFTDMSVGEPRIVVVQEMKLGAHRNFDMAGQQAAIERALSDHFEIEHPDIVFVKPMSLPRTTSGKVKRYECQEVYSEKTRIAS